MFDDEDDDFQPLTKRKKSKENTGKETRTTSKDAVKKKRQGKSATTNEDTLVKQKSASKVKRKTPMKKTPLRERKKYDGFCPRCQMPYSLFIIETPTWHEAECFESYHPELECPDGVDCDCTIQKHFYKYSHLQLAKKRQALTHADQQKKSKQQLSYGKYEKTGKHKTNAILVDDSDEQTDDNLSTTTPTVIPETIPSICKTETLLPSTDTSSSSTDTASKTLLKTASQNLRREQMCMSKYSEVSDEVSSSLPSIASQSIQEHLSPGDLSNYMEDAFKEATFCCEEKKKENLEEFLNDELPASCSAEYEKDLVESFLNDDSSHSRSVCDTNHRDSLCSSKSVSDIDASQESNSKYSIDKKSDVSRMDTLSKSNSSSFSQTCKYCGKMYKFKHACDEDMKLSDDLDYLRNSNINLNGNRSGIHDNYTADDTEENFKSVSDFDDDSNSRSFFVNYKMKKESDARNKCHVCETKLSGHIGIVSVDVSDFVEYAHKISVNGKNGRTLSNKSLHLAVKKDNDMQHVNLCMPCGTKVKDSKHFNKTILQESVAENTIDLDKIDETVLVSQESKGHYSPLEECDGKLSSSQSSHRSDSTTGSDVNGEVKNRKASNKMGKTSKGKLGKNSSDSGGKQSSLLSFFSGGVKNSNGGGNCLTGKTSDTAMEKISLTSSNQEEKSTKLTKIKSVNDVLMCSAKKSALESYIDDTGSSSKPQLVKSASDMLMGKIQTSKSTSMGKRWNNKDVEACGSTNDDKGRKPMRNCPFYKKIPDTGFTVDAFCYGVVPGCKDYFLSHFHYDHYRGLTKKFDQPIYCSQITGNLIKSRININPDIVHCLPMNEPCTVEGTEVTLLDANHCPGSVLFLFKTKSGRTILHTGDFRADPSMEQIPCLQNVPIHQLYLDTTYCDPKYDFPPQNLVIDFGVTLVEKFLADKPNTLVVCGSYTIGKERIFTAISRRFDCKISVERDKYKVLECLEDNDLAKRLTLDFNESFLHVLPMRKLNVQDLHKHRTGLKTDYDYVVAIEPTGWTYNDKLISLDQIKPKGSKDIKIYGLPYSEHSSFLELKRCVQYFRPQQILPTVNNGNPASRKKMENIFHSWLTESKTENKPKQTNLGNWTK